MMEGRQQQQQQISPPTMLQLQLFLSSIVHGRTYVRRQTRHTLWVPFFFFNHDLPFSLDSKNNQTLLKVV